MSERRRSGAFLLALVLLVVPSLAAGCGKPDRSWWREAKFGLFVHWGLYSIPARGEWHMLRQQVPRDEYRRLAAAFNPDGFDADTWASVAKDAGMRYVVVTAKHHDGFAMYGSRASAYNIVDATPYRRDPMKALSQACAKNGLSFGFYYSHAQDWDDPDAAGDYFQMKPPGQRDFARYSREKALPQLTEILTQYGTIRELFLDTPALIGPEGVKATRELVRKLQPQCLVDSRIGGGDPENWDYISCFDNTIPSMVMDNAFEVPATLANGWGITRPLGPPSPLRNVVGMLCDIAGMGGNYLLNVGPDEKGRIPREQVDRLKETGDWLRTHGDAIYGTHANPFGRIYDWGTITAKPGKLFLIFFEKPDAAFAIHGLKNRVRKAYWIHNQAAIPFSRSGNTLTLDAGGPWNGSIFPVAVVEIEGTADVEPVNYQQGNGEVVLETVHATDAATGKPVGDRFCERGTIWKRMPEGLGLEWQFNLVTPGKYAIEVVEFGGREVSLAGFEKGKLPPHLIDVTVAGKTQTLRASGDRVSPHRFNGAQLDLISDAGTVTFSKPGPYTLTAKIRRVAERSIRVRNPNEPGAQTLRGEPRLVMSGLKLVRVH